VLAAVVTELVSAASAVMLVGQVQSDELAELPLYDGING